MNPSDKPLANPNLVLREEMDDWAILFDPDSGDAHALNPVSLMVYKLMDGGHCIAAIIEQVKKDCQDVPDTVEKDIREFVDDLQKRGYIGKEV
jgi:SynChlorMet cassette protein ScmD